MNTDIYQNKSFSDQPNAFEPVRPLNLTNGRALVPAPGDNVMEHVTYLENGDIIVRMYAPAAKEVRVKSHRISVWKFDVEMVNRGDGVFEGLLPANLQLNGDVPLLFEVDGVSVLDPYLPTEFRGNKAVNAIDVYDETTPYVYLRDVPHGSLSREIYYSESVKQYIRCIVYTPPGYEKGDHEYPVLYLQHGGGENETCWCRNGKLPYIMDNNIADGLTVPFIVVMNNGMLKAPYEKEMNDFDGIEGIITNDCRRYIESKYRVRKDKWGRGIAGLSLGSMQACYIGMRHPELFAAIGSFTYIRCRDRDNTHEGNPHLNILKDYDHFWNSYKLFFRSIGSVEAHLNEFEEDDAFIARYGIDQNPHYHRMLIPDQTHNWNCWRRAFYEFSQLVFRED
ncbi:MAG: hypothetical protein IJI46_07250 [Erysipelotrichaceae bacterium]|nr:hypothetical protein [Erysipelotrichaceae bacterium]